MMVYKQCALVQKIVEKKELTSKNGFKNGTTNKLPLINATISFKEHEHETCKEHTRT